MSEAPNAVARRGDLVVICLCHRDWKTSEPLEDDEFRLADRYDAAVTAANSACRELHEQAARTASAAA